MIDIVPLDHFDRNYHYCLACYLHLLKTNTTTTFTTATIMNGSSLFDPNTLTIFTSILALPMLYLALLLRLLLSHCTSYHIYSFDKPIQRCQGLAQPPNPCPSPGTSVYLYMQKTSKRASVYLTDSSMFYFKSMASHA